MTSSDINVQFWTGTELSRLNTITDNTWRVFGGN
jgi:hypothetical protein